MTASGYIFSGLTLGRVGGVAHGELTLVSFLTSAFNTLVLAFDVRLTRDERSLNGLKDPINAVLHRESRIFLLIKLDQELSSIQ